jgi:hypothetical protein
VEGVVEGGLTFKTFILTLCYSCRVFHPAQMVLGICVVTALMFGYNYLTKNQRVVRDLKNTHPLGKR